MIERLFGLIAGRISHHQSKPRFLAFLDYGYMPYALGDTITWTADAQVAAKDAGADEIDVVVLATRERPAPNWQPFVTSFNYMSNVYNLLPAYLGSPMVRSVHILENRQTFYDLVSDAHDRGGAMWPSINALVDERMNFISHLRVVDHFLRCGSIPLLAAPRGYASMAEAFLKKWCPGKFCVVVNVRQSHLRATQFQSERDSQFATWAEFIKRTAQKYNDVMFLVVGQFSDVDRRFSRLPATIVPRSLGFGLGVELALLQGADLFMGTSSGFAQAALFGQPAYIVTHTEHRAAEYCGVPVGARHHPFGRADQIVTWTLETVEELEEEFSKMRALKAGTALSLR